MHTRADDLPTRTSTAVPYTSATDRAAERDAQARQYAERERQEAGARRRRALTTLDTADVVWRLIRIAVYAISTIIALAIVFHLLNANRHNGFVSTIDSWGHSLAGPFAGMFVLHSAKATIGLDYGIAIIVYIAVAELVINLIGAAIVPARRRAAGVTADARYAGDARVVDGSRYPEYP